MFTADTETSPSGPIISLDNLLFDYPGADTILRSRDSYEFRVLKLYIVHSSPILGEKLLLLHNPQPEPIASAIPSELNVKGTAANALCMVELPVDGAILLSLLSYIFPVPPILPSTVEQIMELLSVAQTYRMDIVLTHIRNHIAQQEPPFIREETAFVIYSLAQKHGLRTEALKAARCTLTFSSLIIEDLAKEDKLNMMPGAFLHELWRYHQRARSNLTSDLEEFMNLNAPTILEDLRCKSPANSGLPSWIHSYIFDIGRARVPAFLDPTDFTMRLTEHFEDQSANSRCSSCSSIPRNRIRALWVGLTAAVHSSMAKAEPDFSLLVEGTRPDLESQIRPNCEATSPPKYTNMPNADVILQSSDLVHFCVNRSVLVASSPFFADMFSLPQPQNNTPHDELPVVQLSEDAEVLNSLISMLYPVPPEMPRSIDNILALLAVTAKYDMDAIQTSVRAEVSRRGLLSSAGAEAFRVYAIAYSKGLIPEVENAARLTLGQPLTFGSLGDTLRLFEGSAMRDLAEFRLRSIREFCTKWRSFSDCLGGASKIWVGCPTVKGGKDARRLPTWLEDCLRSKLLTADRTGPLPILEDRFTEIIPTSKQLYNKFLKAFRSHVEKKDCHFCTKVYSLQGEAFCAEMKDIPAQARNVPAPVLGERPANPSNSSE